MRRLAVIAIAFLQIAAGGIAIARGAEKNVVREGALRKVVADFIRERTAGLGLDVRIRRIDCQGDVTLPPGRVDYEVIAPRQWDGWGNANLTLLIRVNDRLERNLSIPVEVEALADMVVTVRPLERGEVITPQDVILQKRDLAMAGDRICRTLAEVIGKRVRIGMRGNAPVRDDYVERVPLVKSGQLVTIVLENDVLRLTATGRARSSGAAGDTVLVQNLSSQKEIPAQVVNSTTVRVNF